MKVWTTTRFEGHWPVGSAAVVVADDREQAARLLEAELGTMGLAQVVDRATLVELDTNSEHAVVLCDGDY